MLLVGDPGTGKSQARALRQHHPISLQLLGRRALQLVSPAHVQAAGCQTTLLRSRACFVGRCDAWQLCRV